MDEPFEEVLEINSIMLFLQSIEWKDPWIIALIFFHITITCTAILTRNRVNFQLILFLTLLVLVYFSEKINELAALNWRLFSRQQYFDTKGLFISIVFSMPILLNCMLLLGNWLWQSTQLTIKLKQIQLRNQLRQRKALEKKSN